MDTDRLNRWLTLGANFGIILGIVFLVIEVRQNQFALNEGNRLSILEARNYELERYNEFRAILVQDEKLSELWMKGLNGEDLGYLDSERFYNLCTSYLWLSVTTYERSIELGREDTANQTVKNRANEINSSPEFKDCWEKQKDSIKGYGIPDYVDAIEALVID